ncbi:hypothetical protein [Rhodococcus sp. X156]|uniref:arsenate reductase/protein-tyrosine-phosphatase family protein n=1 Tax=Rhodococcus sp. X156 TaxID=2499145 RepID=UPI000FD8C363|nr:hypothetical protein [Rhodococcus sp. X156]
MHLLFVCTGNICRSPTAERLTQAYAAHHGLPGLTASSAGTRAVAGYTMEPSAAQVLTELGGDPTGFRARQLKPAMVNDADLVVGLSTRHRNRVLEESPRAMRRAFTLRELSALLAVPSSEAALLPRLAQARAARPPAPDSLDITDPMGQDLATFQEIGRQITATLLPVLDALRAELS